MAGHDAGREGSRDPEPSTKRKPEALSDNSKKLDERSETDDMNSASITDQIELLKDPRLSHTANTEQAAHLIRGLQQTRGNAHVQRLLNSRTVQAKLTVHPADDEYEKEADRVAEMVAQSPQTQAQRQEEEEEMLQDKPAPDSVQRQEMPEEEEVLQGKAGPGAALDIQRQEEEEEEEEMLQPKPAEGALQRQEMPEEEEVLQGKADPGAALDVQRQEEEEELLQPKPAEGTLQRQDIPEEEEVLQTKAAPGAAPEIQTQEEEEELQMKATDDPVHEDSRGLEERIHAARGSGEELPDPVRTSFEASFGRGFGDVRVHSDSGADKLSRELGAKAFTTGRDIFFRKSDYQPHSHEGQQLLGHELTHVVQQNSGTLKTEEERGLQQHAMPSLQPHEFPIQKAPPVSAEAGRSPGKTAYDALQDFVTDATKAWSDNQARFNLALRQFQRTMTMTSEEEAVPDYTDALMNYVVEHVTKKALDKVSQLIPGFDEVNGVLDAFAAEHKRAEQAAEEVSLKQFIQKIDDAMTRNFELQSNSVLKGRAKLWDLMKSYDETNQWMIADSFQNWLAKIRAAIPKAGEYEAALHVAWVDSYRSHTKDWKPQGVIEIKFNAETPGKYVYESAKVLSPFPKKSAEGLNRALSNPETGWKNVLDIPLRKTVGLYAKNIIGGTSYGWALMDENNNTTQTPVAPVPKKRWLEMPREPFEKITKVKG